MSLRVPQDQKCAGCSKAGIHNHKQMRIHKDNVTKKYKKTNVVSGLTASEAYHLEVTILGRLNAITPPANCKHERFFPKLLARNDGHLTVTTTMDGIPLKFLKNYSQLCSIPFCTAIRTAKCMDTLLEMARVKHLDQQVDGKNMLIQGHRLTLYDFDVAEIDNISTSTRMSAIAARHHWTSVQVVAAFYGEHCQGCNTSECIDGGEAGVSTPMGWNIEDGHDNLGLDL